MKKQYWILNDGREVIQQYDGEKEVGFISTGYCSENKTMSTGTYIICDSVMKGSRNKLLMYLIEREEEIIQIHHNERNKYIKMLAN